MKSAKRFDGFLPPTAARGSGFHFYGRDRAARGVSAPVRAGDGFPAVGGMRGASKVAGPRGGPRDRLKAAALPF